MCKSASFFFNFRYTSNILKFDKEILKKINNLVKFLYSHDLIKLEEFSTLTDQKKNDCLKFMPD